MKHVATLIPGDGIGPEVTRPAQQIIAAAGVEIEWETFIAGAEALEREGKTVSVELLDSIRKNKVALKGPLTTPIGEGFSSANVEMRKALDLYANLRPVKSLPGVKSRYENIDLIVIRENTEDLYSGIEHVVVPGVVESLKIITERASTKIAEFGYKHARQQGRKNMTVVHKANIMKLSDGLFLNAARNVAQKYPDIKSNDVIVDNACMQLVIDPYQYDVLLLENLYGDIISDLAAGLVGGLGLVPGANIGDECAIFEAVHGSAPDIKGQNKANPTAMILAAIMMLKYIGEAAAAERIYAALVRVFTVRRVFTRDLGGAATTTEFNEAILKEIEAR
ncbi:MAG TPA: isocitrate dehydrogenase (NAD(+)) [Candidatus Binatia bacterium]|jgi:isocitrate dehydrogenase (NAD+)